MGRHTAFMTLLLAIWIRTASSQRLHGITYSYFSTASGSTCIGEGEYAVGGDIKDRCLSVSDVERDMALMSEISQSVRIYSMVCLEATHAVINSAYIHGMQVTLSLWVNKNETTFEEELGRLRDTLVRYRLIKSQPTISHIIVGNEPLYVQGADPAHVLSAIQRTKALVSVLALDIPVGLAEVSAMWTSESVDFTAIGEACDFLGLQTHPYFAGLNVTRASVSDFIVGDANRVRARWPHRELIVTESGFPTSGATHGSAHPGTPLALDYAEECAAISAGEHALPVFYFEFADADWKRDFEPTDEAHYHFGLYTCDRKPKFLR